MPVSESQSLTVYLVVEWIYTVAVTGDVFSIDLSSYKPAILCGVIKKYLRRLQKPLIPTDFYEDFITASSM